MMHPIFILSFIPQAVVSSQDVPVIRQSPAERLRNRYVGCSGQGLMSLTSIISPFFTNLRERSHCKPNPELFHNFDQLLPTVPRLYRQEGQKLSSALKPGLNREPPACSLKFTETGPGPELRKPGRHRSNYNQQDRRVNTIRRLAGNLHGSGETRAASPGCIQPAGIEK